MRKKLLSLILTGILVFSGTNIAYAATSVDISQEISCSATYINPVYEDVIDEASLDFPEEEYQNAYFGEAVYTTDENTIIEILREGMISRAPYVTVYYETTTYSESLAKKWLNSWVEGAIAECDDPYGGDYLRYSYGAVRYSLKGSKDSATNKYYLAMTFCFDFYTDYDQEEEVQKEIKKVFDELEIKTLANDYLKTKAIYDYICDTVSYDYKQLNNENYKLKYTAYAALINKTAVCQGYSTLLYTMLEQAGVDARVITGFGNDDAHAWNIVRLEDFYYLCDASWDRSCVESNIKYKYFLKGSDDFSNHDALSQYETDEYKASYPIAKENYIYVEEGKNSATGHSYNTAKVTKAATATSEGVKTYTCTNCGKTKTETIPMISSMKLSYKKTTYSGSQQTPKVTVTDAKGKTLTGGTDYTVTYGTSTRKKVGRYAVKITFKGNYSGTKTLYYTIVPKAPSTAKTALYGHDDVKFSWSKSTGASGYKVYYKKSNASCYTYLGSTTGTSYKKANLSDGVKYTFKVVPYYKTSDGTKYKSLKSKTASVYTLKKVSKPTVEKSGAGKVKVKWSNVSGETGYQISRSTSSTGTNIVTTYQTTSGKSKTVSATKGKTYYYKVRAYKTVDGKKIYGPWSDVVKYKLK